jgi:hypothetical protein
MLKRLALGLLAGAASCTAAHARDIEHVLLISVDGLHALDVANYIESHPDSRLAELSNHGVTYTNARTPANSDSFPGLLALVTGGSPVTTGLYYDVSYDRTIYDPSNKTCSGPAGNTMVFDESIDKYGPDNVSLNVIDPAKLPRSKESGLCAPLYPHSALRTNTIFEVIKARGWRTAWADKHPAYDLVKGPSGKGVEDLYTPEITNVNGPDATVSIDCTVANDQLKVKAVLNQINGLTSDGKKAVGVPAIFGMNFQAVSVGQKLTNSKAGTNCPGVNPAHDGMPGGYKDGSGTPSDVLAFGLKETDESLGLMIQALKSKGLWEHTLFIVSAKHGQSPINPVKVNKPGHFADLVAKLPDASTSPAAKAIAEAAACSTGPCGFVQDDTIALIWLKDQSKTQLVADYLNKNANALYIEQVMAGDSLTLRFNNPNRDTRTPDIIVQPVYGTIYTASTAKNAEHGGFNFADTNVALIVSRALFQTGKLIKTPVSTSQVAPTILNLLKINPLSLKSVAIEKTPILPELDDVKENAAQTQMGGSSYE